MHSVNKSRWIVPVQKWLLMNNFKHLTLLFRCGMLRGENMSNVIMNYFTCSFPLNVLYKFGGKSTFTILQQSGHVTIKDPSEVRYKRIYRCS